MTAVALVQERVATLAREGGLPHVLSRVAARVTSPVASWGRLCFFVADPFGAQPRPPRCLVCAAAAEDMDRVAELGAPAAELRARLARGHDCLVAIKGGAIIGASWWSVGAARLPELERDIALGPEEGYCYDARVRPEWRTEGVFGTLIDVTLRELRRRGVRRAYFYARGDNVKGRRAAAGWARPCGSFVYFKRRGGRCFVLPIGMGSLTPGGGRALALPRLARQ